MSEIIKSEYLALNENKEYDTHYFKTSADLVVGLGRMKSTAYKVGAVVYSDTNDIIALLCETAGTTSDGELDVSSKTVGETIADGEVVWVVIPRGVMQGATSTANGVEGLVPAPSAGSEQFPLLGSGEFKNILNFRTPNTAYAAGDIVACPYNARLFLQCTQAGTTSANSLDTTSVTVGQVIEDGGVKWEVIVLPIEIGGTGGTTATAARANLAVNIQSFTDPSELGLTRNATELEILAAMPANSMYFSWISQSQFPNLFIWNYQINNSRLRMMKASTHSYVIEVFIPRNIPEYYVAVTNYEATTLTYISTSNITVSGDDYIRLSDGTQICYGTVQNSGNTIAQNTWEDVTWTFPVAFADVPKVFPVHAGSGNRYADIVLGENSKSTTSVNIRFMQKALDSTSNTNVHKVDVMAIGKWK